jgi:hypothetical protein
MKTGFHDRASIKKQDPKDTPKDGKPVPQGWDFSQPQYDQRSSCFMNAGTHYGEGIKQPVGHHGDPKERAECLPFGKVNTLRIYEEK